MGIVPQICNFVTHFSVPSKRYSRYSLLRSSANNVTEVCYSVTIKGKTLTYYVFHTFLRTFRHKLNLPRKRNVHQIYQGRGHWLDSVQWTLNLGTSGGTDAHHLSPAICRLPFTNTRRSSWSPSVSLGWSPGSGETSQSHINVCGLVERSTRSDNEK